MGSDGTKSHETFTVAPADPDEGLDELHVDPQHDAETAAQVTKLEHTVSLIAGLTQNSDTVDEDVAWLVATAHSEIDELDIDDADKQQWHTTVAAAAADALAALPDQALQQLAADKGFAHPTLVSAS
ncbi:MAG: hypothetical protein WD250_08575, partial [Egibacteraceae bacterium]